MGFRHKRRSRSGGQHHHHHGFSGGEANGVQPGDDVGNRKSFKPVQHPPEDLGNRKDPEESEWVPDDETGNRIDAAPTHELSGILLELDGKRRRRRPKGVAAPERVGRYFVGGVNPLIATNVPRPFAGKTLDESLQSAAGVPVANGHGAPHGAAVPYDAEHAGDGGLGAAAPAAFEGGEAELEGEGGRRRRKRGRGRDQVDGAAAQEVSDRRAQRFFDFEEDDRFDYTLKSDPEHKRRDAEQIVRALVTEAGRDATVEARLLEDGDKPKILVTIDERGASSALPATRRSSNAHEPLFVLGNAALMSLNYLVNKIVNRYPDDRIRLAVLPASGERLYLEALAEHRRARAAAPAALSPPPTAGRAVPLAVVEVPKAAAQPLVVVTPAPVGVAAPEEAFDEPDSRPEYLVAPVRVQPAAAQPLVAHDDRGAAARETDEYSIDNSESTDSDAQGDAEEQAEEHAEGAPTDDESRAEAEDSAEDDDASERAVSKRESSKGTATAPRARTRKPAAPRAAASKAPAKPARSTKPRSSAVEEKPARGRPVKKAPAVEKVVVRAPRKS